MKYLVKSKFLLLSILLVVVSCNTDDNDNVNSVTPVKNEGVTSQIFSNVNDLYVAKGNKNSNKVIIYEEGGPLFDLNPITLEKDTYADSEVDGLSEIDLDDHLEDFYRVYAHQALTYDKKNAKTTIINAKEADRLRELNADILNALVTHFKEKGKEVYVIGHSYGGFVVQQYIAKYGNKKADKFIVLSSRLSMQLDMVNGLVNLKPNDFDEDGETIIPFDEADNPYFDQIKDEPLGILTSGYHSLERFTETIKADVLDNLLYMYALDDESTGRLQPKEISFLKKKNSEVIEIPSGFKHGGHSAPFFDPYASKIIKFIND